MPIISVRDNENNRRKRNTKAKKQIKRKTNKETTKKETQKKKRGTEAIAKRWKLSDFVVHLS